MPINLPASARSGKDARPQPIVDPPFVRRWLRARLALADAQHEASIRLSVPLARLLLALAQDPPSERSGV